MNDVFIYSTSLPSKVKGMIIETINDIIVIVNENLNEEEQQKAARHELRHVKGCHVRDMRNVAELEQEACMAM